MVGRSRTLTASLGGALPAVMSGEQQQQQEQVQQQEDVWGGAYFQLPEKVGGCAFSRGSEGCIVGLCCTGCSNGDSRLWFDIQ